MPNRIIKESICTSDSLEELTDFEENFFYRIIANCDDYGRFDARPAVLKARCYPLRERLTNRTVQDALSSMARVGCVELYEVDGKPYLHLPSWGIHQQIRAKKSKFPAPDSNGNQLISDDCNSPRNPIQSNPIQSNPNPISFVGDSPDSESDEETEFEKKAQLSAEYMAKKILKHTPNFPQLKEGKRAETVERWAKDIEKLLRIDGVDPDEFKQVLQFSQQDPFWQQNILSGRKLREQYPQLLVKMGGNE